MLHGVTSFQLEATPTWGLSQSSSVMPTARSMARAPACCIPSVTSRLRGFMIAHGREAYRTRAPGRLPVGPFAQPSHGTLATAYADAPVRPEVNMEKALSMATGVAERGRVVDHTFARNGEPTAPATPVVRRRHRHGHDRRRVHRGRRARARGPGRAASASTSTNPRPYRRKNAPTFVVAIGVSRRAAHRPPPHRLPDPRARARQPRGAAERRRPTARLRRSSPSSRARTPSSTRATTTSSSPRCASASSRWRRRDS